MKTFMIALSLVGSLSLAHGQSKNDPTYSIHNYKQPNKAEEARLTKNEGVANEAYNPEMSVAIRNYKAFTTETALSGATLAAAAAEPNANALASSRNYKSSFGKNEVSREVNESDPYTSPIVKNKSSMPKAQ